MSRHTSPAPFLFLKTLKASAVVQSCLSGFQLHSRKRCSQQPPWITAKQGLEVGQKACQVSLYFSDTRSSSAFGAQPCHHDL